MGANGDDDVGVEELSPFSSERMLLCGGRGPSPCTLVKPTDG